MHSHFKLNGISFSSTDDLLDDAIAVSDSLFDFLTHWFDQSNFITVQTSGSTGKPKPIAIEKQLMRNSAKATGTFFNLNAGTKALCCLSTDYIAGKMMVIRALELGWHLDTTESTSNPLANNFEEYDFCAMVPMQVKASLWDLHQIKKLIIGGGVVSQELENDLQQLKTACYATYGMTETVTHIAVKKLNHISSKVHYKTLPDITISLDNRSCLVIDAPLLSKEKVITNDVVQLHGIHEFEWLGRYDNVINSGGIKLHPEEIEKELSKIISSRFFVTSIPDEILGEQLILIVEGKPQEFNFTKLTLSNYQIPKQVFYIKHFIETETKKIQRKKTLDLLIF